jgi:hypothetical protein
LLAAFFKLCGAYRAKSLFSMADIHRLALPGGDFSKRAGVAGMVLLAFVSKSCILRQ